MPLNTEDNEWLFDALAQAVDRVEAQQSSLLLAKFSLLLANQVGERALVAQALQSALAHLKSIEPNDLN